jgi:hypothetical protein
MRKHPIHIAILPLAAFLLVTIPAAAAQISDRARREISRTNEKEVSVKVDVSLGTLTVKKGVREKIVIAEYEEHDDEQQTLDLSYKITDEKGRLVVESKDRRRSSKREKSEGRRSRDPKWDLQFTDSVPLSLNLEFGAGKGDLDLTGLQITDLKVASGASSVELTCDEPNRVVLGKIQIESGVSKFSAYNLCNLNFRKMKFEGGVGAYKLDFGGKLRQDAEIDIEVGLGAVSIVIPDDVPARILYDDSWFSSFDMDYGFVKQKKGMYETDSYQSSDYRLTIRIESGLGSVKVRRSR